MSKEVFEHTCGYARSTTGSSPFLRDVDHATLKIDRWLGPDFKTGDIVRVTVEKIGRETLEKHYDKRNNA